MCHPITAVSNPVKLTMSDAGVSFYHCCVQSCEAHHVQCRTCHTHRLCAAAPSGEGCSLLLHEPQTSVFQHSLALQAERLYSPDGSVFLVPQTDGNLVIYNAHAVAKLGHTAVEAAIWQSGTYNNGGPQPFVLAMQQVTPEPPSCALSALHAPRFARVLCSFSSPRRSLPLVSYISNPP